MTSEDKLGINKPPEHQCPKIDKYIKTLLKGIDEVKSLKIEHEIDVDSALWYLDDLESNFEDLRTALEEVRVWGQSWKDEAKEMINYYEPHKLNNH